MVSSGGPPRRGWRAGRARFISIAVVAAALLVLFVASWPLQSEPAEDDPAPLAPAAVTMNLPFDLPAPEILQASGRKVFAHYFPPYPLSIDNLPADEDYYSRHYLAQGGENGRHRAYGGLLRERPLPVPVSDSQDWIKANLATEVARASAAGIDGFMVDVLDLDGANWERVELLVAAAEESDSGFTIVLMPDATSLDIQDAPLLAQRVAQLSRSPAMQRLDDGRLVVAAYAPERFGGPWWRDWLAAMSSEYDKDIAFVPCFLDFDGNVDAFDSFSYGFGNWGNRNPAANSDLLGNMEEAHRRGKIWMQPVSVQDQRPSQGVYDEANNSENLRVTWKAAIRESDWVQITTWNDYSEGSAISPSTGTGWNLLEICAYYIARFKTGLWPEIQRDAIYLSHRTQFVDEVPTEQERLMDLRPGSSPARDAVEVLALLTEPATVRVVVGGRELATEVDAGLSVIVTELRQGRVSAEIQRDGRTVVVLASPFPVRSQIRRQDLGYHFSGDVSG